MRIKQDPITKLWCRTDGAILMPPSKYGRFRKLRWVFGVKQPSGYLTVRYKGKQYYAHQLVCRAFHGICPEGKRQVDHIDRDPVNNKSENLRWCTQSENMRNTKVHVESVAKYGVASADNRAAYQRARYALDPEHRKKQKAWNRSHRAKKKAGKA